jgi:ATP-dependent Clp protease ATP-binding subunit ClpC
VLGRARHPTIAACAKLCRLRHPSIQRSLALTLPRCAHNRGVHFIRLRLCSWELARVVRSDHNGCTMPELSVVADLVWRVAAFEARRAGSGVLGVDHLLVGLLSLEKLLEPSAGLEAARREAVREEHDVISQLLARLDRKVTVMRREIRRSLPRSTVTAGAIIHRDDACRAVFARAAQLARDRGSSPCGALHLFAALLEAPPSSLVAALPEYTAGNAINLLRIWFLAAVTPTREVQPIREPEPPDADPLLSLETPSTRIVGLMPAGDDAPADPADGSDPETPRGPLLPPFLPSSHRVDGTGLGSVPSVLLRYGRDLTAEAEAGKLGPVVGRRDEMLHIVRVLHRRSKNSPVLIGEAGVGKTAVVEGLAHRIAEGSVLHGRRIVALNLASVLAGASYRGQFEERLEEILAELRARPDIILFLDELHTIVGAGDRDGRLDAANILKPALARGEIACIGATTTDEYHRHIATDPALERRFQPVTVAEPTPDEARAIVAGLHADLERHHGVTIDPAALDAAVQLTVRYVTGRHLPDKAVDALDEACARASVPSLTSPASHAALAEDGTAVVTRETVAEVVSAWTGIPLGRIGQAEADRLADLEARLAERVFGQAEALAQVAQRVRLARTGMTDPERPAGVFLFLGPSGVGKTELARALADVAVDGPQRLIRLDMSEYGEKHAAARLIGAPPGYQGHGDEGQLTGPLRRNPHAIVLLDEAEKAHPEVFDLFLQLFDAGRLTDASGRLVDGRQAIFILTSNLQSSSSPGRRALGFGDAAGGRGLSGTSGSGSPGAAGSASVSGPGRETLLTELRQCFRPELLNRIDEIVQFQPLGEPELAEIAERQLRTLRRRLLDQHEIDLWVTPLALAFLARRAAAGTGGARELQRIITRLVEGPLSHDLLTGDVMRGEHLIAELNGERIALVRDTRTL